MPRKKLDQKIQAIRENLLILSSMVETAIFDSVLGLCEQDVKKSHSVLQGDKQINKKRYQIEWDILTVIATEAPIAQDLRFLASSLAVCSELERIGDYAKTVAKVYLRSREFGSPKLNSASYKMGVATSDSLHRAIAAFVFIDDETAKKIIPEDDLCDSLYKQIYGELMSFIVKDARNIDFVNNYLWMAHNLERAGDRVTNICERAIYVKTGEFSESLGSMDGL